MSRRGSKSLCHFLAISVTLFWFGLLGFSGGAEAASTPHFPSAIISYTYGSAVYLVNLKIGDIPAQTGDEVAFFDPRGAICGWAAVDTNTAEYLPITVYGDDGSTGTIEGAKADEMLTVKVWDASAGLELSGTALLLSPGPAQGSYLPSAIPPVWQDNTLAVLQIDTATYFSRPTPTPPVSYYIGHVSINGVPTEAGDEIAVFDQNGVLCGSARLADQGAYVMAVYGDDTTTPQIDEGVVEGERLTFRVWDKSASREYVGSDLRLTPGTAVTGSSYVPSPLPPIWLPDGGYVLDINAASVTKGDVNGDNRVDIGDAILALKVCAGFTLAYPDVYPQADVNGDGRIGVEEAIYILQKAAGLR